jgi:hypothetical protein
MEMTQMDRSQKIENSLQERIDDYLSSFKSQNDTSPRADTASGLAVALDNYLLERAAEELRVAQARLNKLKLELGRKGPGDAKK